jgi:glycosyltransferase involved in cell wall biosynthesis
MRVISHQLAALRAHGHEGVVLLGEEPQHELPGGVPCAVLPGLAYDTTPDAHDPQAVARDLLQAARDKLGGEPDLVHVHNHSLGKNAVTAPVVRRLAEDGVKLLLQIHDFAEDGRPDNYTRLCEGLGVTDPAALGELLYPTGPHIHYATLNRRDRGFLQDAGLEEGRAHALANAVDLGDDLAADTGQRPAWLQDRLFLYPTRAIRRKNLGEFLLWSALAGEGDLFAVTLAPKNPHQRPVYERWVAFAKEAGLPVRFEAGGTGIPFGDLLRSATALTTTSVGEGFGLAFLEPWLVGEPLCGRRLPEITDEFVDDGVDLSMLYDRLEAPVEWVSEDELRGRICDGMTGARAAFGRETSEDDLEAAHDAAVRDGRVDIGRLDEPLQERVIRRLASEPGAQKQMRPSFLFAWGPEALQGALEKNRARVREKFSLERYGDRLMGAYRAVAEAEPGPVEALDGGTLLDRFLAPERFSLLLT